MLVIYIMNPNVIIATDRIENNTLINFKFNGNIYEDSPVDSNSMPLIIK